jgi:hypothetical protein
MSSGGKEEWNSDLDEIVDSMVNHSFLINKKGNYMRNILTLSTFIAFITIVLPSAAIAQCCKMGGGPIQVGAISAMAPETLQKFNKETRGQQEQLIDKQALLKKEWLKDDPDPETIATIRKSIIDIQKEMQKVAKKLGIKNWQMICCLQQENCGSRGFGGGMRSCGKECRGHVGGTGPAD